MTFFLFSLPGIDKGECEMFNYLEDASTGYVSLDVKNKNLDTASYCGNGYCNWQPATP